MMAKVIIGLDAPLSYFFFLLQFSPAYLTCFRPQNISLPWTFDGDVHGVAIAASRASAKGP